jgi:hypothetical protein
MHDTYILLVVEYLCRLIVCVLMVGLTIIGAIMHASMFIIAAGTTIVGVLLVLTLIQLVGILALERKVKLPDEFRK